MIETLIRQLADTLPPSSKGDLDGFSQDLDHAFWEARKVFASAKISLTSNPLRLIEVTATVVDNVANLADVTRTLQNIWASVAYTYFEASNCEWYREGVVLRFVSIIQQSRFFVSGALVVEGDSCMWLIAEYQRKLDRTLDSLPSMSNTTTPKSL
jgi:hypothetical protein